MLQSRIRRGQMDRQITFIKKVVGSNTTNEDEITDWVKVDSNPKVWSKFDQKPGREVVVSDQIQSVINGSFIVDWREDITEENRIVLDEKVYNIISVSEHEGSRKGFLFIQVESIPKLTWTE